jgi:hypothetical protein
MKELPPPSWCSALKMESTHFFDYSEDGDSKFLRNGAKNILGSVALYPRIISIMTTVITNQS